MISLLIFILLMPFKFEDLRIWQSIFLLRSVGWLRLFLQRNGFVLNPQIQRAADSVALNITESSTGQSNAEFKKFLGYAHGQRLK